MTRVNDFLRQIGGTNQQHLRHEIQRITQESPGEAPALPGETPEDSRQRVERENRLLYALIWECREPSDALAVAGMHESDFVPTFERTDFAVRLEHQNALKALLGSSRGFSELMRGLGSDDEKIRQKAAETLVGKAGNHNLFRSQIVQSLSKEKRGPDSPESARALFAEMLKEANLLASEAEASPAPDSLPPQRPAFPQTPPSEEPSRTHTGPSDAETSEPTT